MKNTSVLVFMVTNLVLLIYYIDNIVDYYGGHYNYDGWRYLIPISIADLLMGMSLVFIFVKLKFNKYSIVLFSIAVAHNLAIGTGTLNFPFVGSLIAMFGVIYVIFYRSMFFK